MNLVAFGHKMEEYRKNDSTGEIQRMISELYMFFSLTQENQRESFVGNVKCKINLFYIHTDVTGLQRGAIRIFADALK